MKVEETSHCTSTIYDQTTLLLEAVQTESKERVADIRENGVRQKGATLVLVNYQVFNSIQHKLHLLVVKDVELVLSLLLSHCAAL